MANFMNPLNVNIGNPGSTGKPYIPWGSQPVKAYTPNPPAAAPTTGPTYGPMSVRATGTGPFDATYRQNLATYAGGLFQNPSGLLQLNPTGNLFGQATTGGNAPALGMPATQVNAAFNTSNPLTTGTPSTNTTSSGGTSNSTTPTLQQWLQQMLGGSYGNLGTP